MSYKVLARKWRPRDFDTMLGQSHVIQALKNALDQDRLHHAYLFTGTRGVGKTTIARVFAKALSCENGISSNPCGTCSNCVSIDEGTFIDMLEVDAASRTGVDDTRDLLENVQYLPSVSRYKVYLIDEVHMFSNSSFNALLKTLEEPPEHVMFLLATTEPQKLPMTVLSRCLQFNLSRLGEEEISGYFDNLLKKEKVDFDEASLALLAEAADGSVRDGLSLLDQAIAFGSGSVQFENVKTMLGTVEGSHIQTLLENIVDCDATAAMQTIEELSAHTTDFSRVLDAIAKNLHHLSVQQLTDAEAVAETMQGVSKELVQLMYQIAIKAKQDLPLAPTARIGLEMGVLRMIAFMPTQTTGVTAKTSTKKKQPIKPVEQVSQSAAPQATEVKEVSIPENTRNPSLTIENWTALVPKLGLNGLALELGRNSVLVSYEDKKIVLNIKASYVGMATENSMAALKQALADYTGDAVDVEIQSDQVVSGETKAEQDTKLAVKQQEDAVVSILEDPHVHELQKIFGAKIDKDSIQTLQKVK